MSVDESLSVRRQIVVIGGGISGLAAAHRLKEIDPATHVTLLEASDRLGGVLQTVHSDGFLVERSADSFITLMPWATSLCRRIGFDDQLIPTRDGMRRAFVVREGQICQVPDGFVLMRPDRLWPILTTPILSWQGKARLACEALVPARRDEADESVASFVRRRLGREAFERIVQPLLGGIYTADPELLSMAATMPQFVEQEQTHGGLIRAAWKMKGNRKAASSGGQGQSGARYGMFVTPREGLSSFVAAVAASLPQGTVQLNRPAKSLVQCADGRWEVAIEGGHAPLEADGVIVATPASHAARLVADVDSRLADELSAIPMAGTAVVSLGYRRDQIKHPLDGFGLVVPAIEGRQIIAASFSSVKYEGRAPDGSVLVRVFIGGALQEELAARDDDELIRIATGELAELLGVSGAPNFSLIARWPATMPQYHVGHIDRIDAIEARTASISGLELAGNAYRGVGIPQCIHSGESAAERVLGTAPIFT